MESRLREAGDAGLLIELEDRIDVTVNAQAVAIAAALRAQAVPGVRDVVPTYRSVAVYLNPLTTSAEGLQAAVAQAQSVPPATVTGRTIEVPVRYGGPDGPDLDDVARRAGMPLDEAIARHAGTPYRVFMIGFLPGFAYMGLVDPALAAPRRAVPRPRVPAGSVGIAGRQTGIYPQPSPGGWQIIGRTSLRVFDAARSPAALLQPGDDVRFISDPAAEVDERSFAAPLPAAGVAGGDDDPARSGGAVRGGRYVTVLRPGLLTTVQDGGRWGHQASGVAIAGALDLVSHRIANALVGNGSDAAGLEVTLAGPEIRLERPATLALAGADLGATIDGTAVPLHAAVSCRAGGVLRFGARRTGARTYVAFDGGIVLPPVLGSRATHLLSRLGGMAGRALAAGDRLPLGEPRTAPRKRRVDLPVPAAERGARVRVLPGPQADTFFAPDTAGDLHGRRFGIASQSDRMGYRLTGARLAPLPGREMISDATFTGGLQVPPSGEPILLMADRQTTGGYPQVATVITADLPLVAQLAPGDWVELVVCTRAEAVAALVAQEGKLLAIG